MQLAYLITPVGPCIKVFLKNLSTLSNFLLSSGRAFFISDPLKMLSKYIQFFWHESHASIKSLNS
jgi:hypothetical protein